MKAIFSALGMLGLIACQAYPAAVYAANPKASPATAGVEGRSRSQDAGGTCRTGQDRAAGEAPRPADGCERTDEVGVTPSHAAAGNGHRDIVSALLGHGANVNAKDKRGATPLLRAAANGHTETIRLLLDKGARLKAQDISGANALMLATNHGHLSRR